jgi:hypothetical protein
MRERIFGQDYAKTLASRRNNFRSACIDVRQVVSAKAALKVACLCASSGSFRVVENTQRKRQLVRV